ncbi:MFS transporter [Halovulum dunhuangense]|uniref:MFS transporter n=1 Tax=Halovulum dunhuangense TaxID=1505036 RepID=A0A849KZT5_9RHOB|nr:MFS transporter [Halovulum dunhuangense]
MNPEARRAQIHTAAFYAAMFGAIGVHLPFWPVWLEDWGLSTGEVGFYLSLGVASRVVAGLGFPVLADRLGQRRLTMVGLCLISAVLFLLHLGIGGKPALLAATVATGALLSGIMPLGEALGAGAARHHGFSYALPRAVGSVAFLVTNIAVGWLIERHGANAGLWWLVACLLLAAALGRGHPGGGTLGDARPPGFREIGALLIEPTFALFTLASALVLSSHAVYYVYGSVHWRSLGLDEATIGALWAFSVAVEVLVMTILGPRLMTRLGPIHALAIAAVGGMIRWGAMMFDPGVGWLWALQMLHSASFVAGHLGAIAFIAAAVPERFGGSAQGAFMGLGGGVLTALAMGLSALVYPALGGLTYGIALAMSAAGLWFTLRLGARWGGRVLAV